MKTEQPISRQPAETPKTLLAEKHLYSSAQTVPNHGIGHSKDIAAFSSEVFEHQQESSEETTPTWTKSQTFRFALVSCGLFWLVVALGVWAYANIR